MTPDALRGRTGKGWAGLVTSFAKKEEEVAKVIGDAPEALKQITHARCAKMIEYAEGEVRTLWSGSDYGGGPDGAEGFTCPHCGHDVITRRW